MVKVEVEEDEPAVTIQSVEPPTLAKGKVTTSTPTVGIK